MQRTCIIYMIIMLVILQPNEWISNLF